ncbi:MAG: cation:H+ antiporter [Alphaproteobacteria bacterium]|jgi:cation:H+ antiporter
MTSPLIMAAISCTAGLFLLFYCGNRLVDGAVFVAHRFKLSSLFIGVAIIGFGTSLPEIIATVSATLADRPSLAFGNIIGSNIANIALVLGVGLLLMKKFAPTKEQIREYLIMMMCMWLFAFIIITQGQVNMLTGCLLLLGLIFYLFLAHQSGKKAGFSPEEVEEEVNLPKNEYYAGAFIAFGLLGLFVGADLTIDGAIVIAESFGISERIIGLTLVAVGTSLPEIAATIAAARHGNIGLTLGNVAGSNVFNALGATGTAAIVRTLTVHEELANDLFVMLILGFVVAYLFLVKKPNTKALGITLIVLYFAYIISLTWS